MTRVLAALLMLAAMPGGAEPLTARDRFSVSGGVFHRELSLIGEVRAEGEFGDDVYRFADDFDLEHRKRVNAFELSWSPWPRHEFSVDYHRDVRHRTVRLSEQLEFEGEIFPVDVDLDSSMRFSALSVDYTAWLVDRERAAFGLQFGVLRLSASFALAGRVQSNGDAVQFDASRSDRMYAPLFGIAGRRVFGKSTRGFIELRAIELSYDGLDGRALSGTAGIEYFFSERFGLVLQYLDTRVRVSESNERFDGRVEFGLSGPQALLKLRF